MNAAKTNADICCAVYAYKPTAICNDDEWLYLLTQAKDGRYVLRTAFLEWKKKQYLEEKDDEKKVSLAEHIRGQYESNEDDCYDIDTEEKLCEIYNDVPIHEMVEMIKTIPPSAIKNSRRGIYRRRAKRIPA